MRIDFAKELAVKIGRHAMKHFDSEKDIEKKDSYESVTRIDKECEQIVRDELTKEFPQDGVLGEETGKDEKDAEYFWVVDPIDGTHNYIFGLPIFGSAIAIVKNINTDPVVEHAVIYLTALDKVLYASKGQGAFLDSNKMQVSQTDALENAKGAIGPGFMLWDTKLISRLEKKTADARVLGCATYDFYLVANGSFDFYVTKQNKDWDNAPGALIMSEAGAKMTDFGGNPWTFGTKKVVVSNGKLHEELLEYLKDE